MKDRTKDDAMQKEHHELKKAFRNHEHDDSDHLNDTFDKHTELISNCDVIEELNLRWLLKRFKKICRLIASSWVFNSKSVELSWNFFEKVSSQVEKLNSRTQVELRSLTQ